MEAAMLAPKAEVSMFPWKEPKERIPLAVRQIRSFLRGRIGLLLFRRRCRYDSTAGASSAALLLRVKGANVVAANSSSPGLSRPPPYPSPQWGRVGWGQGSVPKLSGWPGQASMALKKKGDND